MGFNLIPLSVIPEVRITEEVRGTAGHGRSLATRCERPQAPAAGKAATSAGAGTGGRGARIMRAGLRAGAGGFYAGLTVPRPRTFIMKPFAFKRTRGAVAVLTLGIERPVFRRGGTE